MRHIIFLAAMLLTTPVIAGDYRIKITEIAKGSSVTYLPTEGPRYTHHFEGQVDGGYLITFWIGYGKGLGHYAGSGIYNSDGRMVSYTPLEGKTVSYSPHNCFRVVGTCFYTASRADGSSLKMGRRLTPIDDGFRFENFTLNGTNEDTIALGYVALDDMGMMKKITVEESRSPNMPSMEVEIADYR